MKKIVAFIVFSSFMGIVFSQQAVVAGGGHISGMGGSASYSIGQIDTKLYANQNFSLKTGVIQPYEISDVLDIKYLKKLDINCVVYPNPTQNNITLKIEEDDYSFYDVSLYGSDGKMISNKKIEDNKAVFDMRKLSSAVYFLEVKGKDNSGKVFKIIKN